MKLKALVLSIVFAVACLVGARGYAAPCDCDGAACGETRDCARGDCDGDRCQAAPVVALTYPVPYNGEPPRPRGLTLEIKPPRPAPAWPRWVPVRPAPPPRPIGPPPRPLPPPRR